MSEASRDENFVTTLLAVSSVDGVTPVTLYANPTTHRLLVDLAGGGGTGTVTTVSVASANGFAGTVATATTTPVITLSTSITGILKGNGTAISAVTIGAGLSYDGTTLSASGGGSGDVVGPASSVDSAVALFDGLTGKLLKDSATTIATTPTVNTLVKRDASVNIYVNNYFANLTQTVSASGTTILTIASARTQTLTGVLSQTFQLPVGTTLPLTSIFVFNNNSSGSLIITNAGATTVYTIPAGGAVNAFITDNSTSNGVWDFHAEAPASVTWGSGITGLIMNSVLTTSPSVGSGASSSTAPSFIPQRGASTTGFGGDGTRLYATIAGTAAQTVEATGTTAPKFTATTDNAYDATTWNGSLRLPTENAIRDKVETLQLRVEYFVAASDATAREIARADYLCDGTADEVQINTALDLIRATGGTVRLSTGSFAIAASINMLGNVAESDANPFMALLGAGSESTTLTGGSNINVISTGQRAKYEIAYFTAVAAGSGDCISQTAGTERGNWQSWIHDVYLQGNFVDHTGWGIDMQSPFRMRFTNIEMNGVANGCNLVGHTNAFNPGNLTVDRMFIDLWNDASNASAIGFQLKVNTTTSTNVMNLVSVNRLDIAGGTALTSSIGISIVGASASYGDSRHHSFTNLNIEDVQTVIKHVRGRDCTYRDINYCRPLSGGTIIDLDSNSHNNSFENLYAVAQGASQTFNLIVDANGSANLPNSLKRVDGFQPSTVTINATLASNTILEQIDLSGGSPTIDADITNRNNVVFAQNIELNGTDTTISRASAGQIAVEGVQVQTISNAVTVTNKRPQPRTASSTTASTLTPDLSSANVYFRTTQTATLTIDAPTGTPVIGETIMIYVDSAGAQTLTINATYIPFGAAFPATTTAGKTFMMSCQYNGTNWKTLWANAV